jgi:putative hydrolase of the HAD superfamily
MADLKARRHLFFDLDDTLWDFEGNSSQVLQELFHEFALENKLGAAFPDFYKTYMATNLDLWTRYYQKQIDKAYLRNHRFNLVFNSFNYDNYEENLAITNQYLERAPRGKLLKEGCLEVLGYLKQSYELHLITNGFKEVQGIKLDNCGLRGYFSAVVISEEHQLTKPDEQIFRLAEAMAGARHSECIMIGDNFECDVQGALAAGWEAIYFPGREMPAFKGHTIRSLYDLKALL